MSQPYVLVSRIAKESLQPIDGRIHGLKMVIEHPEKY